MARPKETVTVTGYEREAWSREYTVGIPTRVLDGKAGFDSRKGTIIFVSSVEFRRTRAHITSYQMDAGAISPELKRWGHEAGTPPFSVGVKINGVMCLHGIALNYFIKDLTLVFTCIIK
jgi:hypothetical protein